MDHYEFAEKTLNYARQTKGYVAFFDGCCEPRNPGGTAGWGALIQRNGERIWEASGFLPPEPTTSNNIAEYLAVTAVLDWLIENDPKASALVFGDSRLVICQLWGWPVAGRKWRIKGGFYAETALAARTKLLRLRNVKGYWIPRKHNSEADDLSKSHLRTRGVEFRIQPEGKQAV